MRKNIIVAIFLAICPMLYAQQSYNNDAIIKLVKAGLSDDLIVSTINATAASYDASVDGIIALKSAGASDKVVTAIVVKTAASAPPVQPLVAIPALAPQAEAPQQTGATEQVQDTPSVWNCLLNKADYNIVFGNDEVTVTPLAGGFSAKLKIRTNKKKNKQSIQGQWAVSGKSGYIAFIKWSDTQIDAYLLEGTGPGAVCDTKTEAVFTAMGRASDINAPFCQNYTFSFVKRPPGSLPSAPSNNTYQSLPAPQEQVSLPVMNYPAPAVPAQPAYAAPVRSDPNAQRRSFLEREISKLNDEIREDQMRLNAEQLRLKLKSNQGIGDTGNISYLSRKLGQDQMQLHRLQRDLLTLSAN